MTKQGRFSCGVYILLFRDLWPFTSMWTSVLRKVCLHMHLTMSKYEP